MMDMLLIFIPGVTGAKICAAVVKRTRVHSRGFCGAGVSVPSAQPAKCVTLLLVTILNRGAPAPQCVPLRISKPSSSTAGVGGTVRLPKPVIVAPAAEQSVVRPFFDSSSPKWGSLALPAEPFIEVPSSGNPRPASHAEVTIRDPGAGPQSPALPMNTNGIAWGFPLLSSSLSKANRGATANAVPIATRTILFIIGSSKIKEGPRRPLPLHSA